jgi:hypothetical protein
MMSGYHGKLEYSLVHITVWGYYQVLVTILEFNVIWLLWQVILEQHNSTKPIG